jgi:hypothetical protein
MSLEWTDQLREELEARWGAGESRGAIKRAMGLTNGQLNGRITRYNLHPRGRRSAKDLSADHPAMIEARTKFRSQVSDPHEAPLQPGHHSVKLGPVVTKGKWKGFPIYSLTLEERATCPSDCALLSVCYGNNMHFARRFVHGELLEARLYTQLESLAEKHRHGFVVRLHVLGDFYSADYVEFWRLALREYRQLRIFGYSAWRKGTKIYSTIERVRHAYPTRFKVRTSGEITGFRTVVIDRADQRGAAIVCPVETGRAKTCGSCALCWSTDKPIAFLRH